MPDSAISMPARVLFALCSGVAGAVLVVAAFKVDSLNWMVDGPGWLVSRFVSIDFHEGEGAFGFFFAIVLSWAGWSMAAWLMLLGIRRLLRRG
jgi:hypothetical protein